jgi:Protein of unknown function (DUF3606)
MARRPNDKRHKRGNAMAYVFESVPADRALIDVENPREIQWWSKRFGCSVEQLLHAVEEAGNCAAQVAQLLDGKAIVIL